MVIAISEETPRELEITLENARRVKITRHVAAVVFFIRLFDDI